MSEIRVPDIGDFDAVEIIEVLVAAGDEVTAEQPLIVLESEKASMEVPAPQAGRITEMKVAVGDKVAQGDVIALLAAADETGSDADAGDERAATEEDEKPAPESKEAAAQAAKPPPSSSASDGDAVDVVVLGSGPGGYTAAFRAADLGLNTVLIEQYPSLGGVCLNVGCIPSKALLHTAHVIDEAVAMEAHGVSFEPPTIDLPRLREFKDSVVERLTGGLVTLAKKRKVRVIHGRGEFTGKNELRIEKKDGEVETLRFAHAIIAAGSRSLQLPGLPWDDERLFDSTGALALADIPGRMLVIGGGIIGLEMANVYAVLGASVDVVELTPDLVPGCDRDLIKPLQKRMAERLDNIWLGTKVSQVEAAGEGLKVHFEGEDAPAPQVYARVLVAVGRRPNGDRIGAEAAGVEVDGQGFIRSDAQQRSNQPHIFAIGDVTGPPMLAHKATHEGKVAAEVIAGHKVAFDARCIPSVVYTDPEVAWVGLTETEAQEDGIAYEKGQFPWAANGRSLGMGYQDGLTKILFDPETGRCLGAGAVGPNAGELMAELGLAIEMGADWHDIGLTIHAHPTLSESVGMAAEAAAGTLTDLYLPKRSKKTA